MPENSQSKRTFFVTSNTLGQRPFLQSDRMARLLLDVLQTNRKLERLLLHEFVIMPNHFHLLLTPAVHVSLEKVMQYVKGGFSYRVKKELNLNVPIWQASFTNHRVRGAADYNHHRTYIWDNPVKAGLVECPERFPYSSAFSGMDVDPAPPVLKPDS